MLTISTRCIAPLGALLACLMPCLTTAEIRSRIQSACHSEPSLLSMLASDEVQSLMLVYSERLIQPQMKAVGTPPGSAKQRLTAWLAPYNMTVLETGSGSHLIVQADTAPEFTAGRLTDAHEMPITHTTLTFGGGSVPVSSSGCFLIPQRLSKGEQLLVEGFEPAFFPAPEDGWVTVQLKKNKHPRIEEISVIGSRFQMMQSTSQMSLDREDIAHVPHLGDDITRMFSRLPGTAAGDYSPKVNVRGGMPNEHGLFLDGLELHQPWYFKGLDGIVSIVDSNIIDSVDFLSGGFTADYGGKSSGLTNITTMEPGSLPTTMGASFMTAFAQASGEVNNRRQGWMTSLRSGYLDLAFQLAGVDADVQPRYYDLFSKVQTELGERNVLTLHVLSAHDDFELEDRDVFALEERVTDGSSNNNLWLALHTDINWISATNVISLTDYSHRLTGFENSPSINWQDDRHYQAFGWRSDWTATPFRNHLFKIGVDVKRLEADYDY